MTKIQEAKVLARTAGVYKPYRSQHGRMGLLYELSSGGGADRIFGQSQSLYRDPVGFVRKSVLTRVAESEAELVVFHLPSTKGADGGYFRFDALGRIRRLGLDIKRISRWRDAIGLVCDAGADVYVYLGSPRTKMTEDDVDYELDPYLNSPLTGIIIDAAEKSNRDTARKIRTTTGVLAQIGVEPRPRAENTSTARQYRPSVIYDRVWWAFGSSGDALDRGWFRRDPDLYPSSQHPLARAPNLARRGVEVMLSLVPPRGARRPTRAIANALTDKGYTVLQYGYRPWWSSK